MPFETEQLTPAAAGSYPAADMPENAPLALTPEQVSAELQVSVATVHRLIERGELYHVRVGRFVRVPRAALDAFLRGEAYPSGGPIAAGPDANTD